MERLTNIYGNPTFNINTYFCEIQNCSSLQVRPRSSELHAARAQNLKFGCRFCYTILNGVNQISIRENLRTQYFFNLAAACLPQTMFNKIHVYIAMGKKIQKCSIERKKIKLLRNFKKRLIKPFSVGI